MGTYYMALPFTPHDTLLYHLYEPETSHSITVLQGLDPIWTSCLANFVVKDHASVVLVSPDGMRLAVGGHGYISLWDTQTTALRRYLCDASFPLIQPLIHPKSTTISFSESTVAAVWDGCLYISDTITATKRATRELKGYYVYAVAFSWGGQYLLLSIDESLHLYVTARPPF